MRQRVFSLILALALLCALLPAAQAVEYPLTFLYEEENGEAHITGYSGQVPEVLVIPESLDGLPVTAIMHYAFRDAPIRKLVLPSTMRVLCQACFADTPLTEVVLNDGLKEISGGFGGTKLTRVTIPASVTYVSDFGGIDTLTDLYILGTEVDGYLPSDCRVFCHRDTELAANASEFAMVYYFEELPFDPLTDEIVTEGDLQYVLHDGEATLWSCRSEGDVIIPDTLDGCPVVCIAPKCFTGDVRNLTLPDSIRSILRKSCRAQSRMQSVNLPASLEYIGENAFVNLSLGRVELPEPLTYVGYNAFYACGITELICNDALRTIGDHAFSTQPLTSVTLNDGLEVIGAGAFAGTNLRELTVPATVTDCANFLYGSEIQTVYGYPGNAAEVECDECDTTFVNLLTGQAYPPTYSKTIDGITFRVLPTAGYAILKSTIPPLLSDPCIVPETVDGFPVRRIETDAFYRCSFTSVYLPDTITEIRQNSFMFCSNLKLVRMSESIQFIGTYAFMACEKLFSLYLPASFTETDAVMAENHSDKIGDSFRLIVGCSGTLAEEYCEKKHCAFLPIDPDWDDFIITEDAVYSIENGKAALQRACQAYNSTFSVPDTVNGYSVTAVVSGAFCGLKGWSVDPNELVLGNNVRRVEAGIFSSGYFPNGIYMPVTVESFASLPPSNAECTIFGARGSYAERYAKNTGLLFADFSTIPFTDVSENSWYFPYIHSAYWAGLMNGTSPTTFEPNQPTTRAMVVKVLANMSGVDSFDWRYGFTDVPEGQWYTDAVNWGRYYKIVNGTSATTFSPDAPVTREQLAAFLFRYAQACGVECLANGNLSPFTDRNTISSYALDAVTWAVGVGIINGTGKTTISPQAYATRAEIAAMLTRFLAFVNRQ